MESKSLVLSLRALRITGVNLAKTTALVTLLPTILVIYVLVLTVV